MFVGHYAGAFLARAYAKELPLGAAFLGAQFVDLWWDLFILTGVERARLVPGLPSNPLDLYFMPYSHGLVATALWALAVFVVVKLARLFGGSTRVALATAGAVASHWFLDLVVHRADLPLAGDASHKLGFGLWNQPALALVVEIAVLALSAAAYLRATGERAPWIFGFVAVMAVVQVGTVVGPLPPTIPAMTASLFFAYLGLAWSARWVQRRATPAASGASRRAQVP